MPAPALSLSPPREPALRAPEPPSAVPESRVFPGFPARGPGSWTPYLAVFVWWTGIGMFLGARMYVNWLLFHEDRFDPRLQGGVLPLLTNLFDAYMWAFYTLAIFRTSSAFPLQRGQRLRSIPVHVAVALTISVVSVRLNMANGNFLYPDDPGSFSVYFSRGFYVNLMWYGNITVVWHFLDYYRRWRDREVQAARLGEQLAQAQLEALKMQIQPHFLFNTLHAISELVHEDPDAADRTITRLGDLLRLTVDNAGTHEVTLAQEMEFLRAYLEIQQSRFQDTLVVHLDTPPETMDALVPNLVLQPLVENAIRHGVAPLGGVGRVDVTAARQGGRLELEVRDNGRGLPASRDPGAREGVGVRNTRARLEQLYGAEHRFEVRNGERGGAVARVSIPFRAAPAPSPTAGGVR